MFTDLSRTISPRAMRTSGTRPFVSLNVRAEADFVYTWVGSD
jgi:hypothetical protein